MAVRDAMMGLLPDFLSILASAATFLSNHLTPYDHDNIDAYVMTSRQKRRGV